MIEFKIWNSLTNQNFNKVQFSKYVDNNIANKCINLVYGSNAIGKSSLSKIIQSKYDVSKEVVNLFNGKKSTIDVLEDIYGITSAFRYDREFVQNSVGLYEEKLVIAPDTGKEYSENVKRQQDLYRELVSAYKNDSLFKKGVLSEYSSDLNNTKLYPFSLKGPNAKVHAPKMYDYLININKPEKLCNNYSTKELIEIGLYVDANFIDEINLIKEKTDSAILEEFPEIAEKDYNLYKTILEYLDGNNDLINQICLMCGKTVFTKELIDKRIDRIKEIINQYLEISSNSNYNALMRFQNSKFTVENLIEIQELLKSVNKQNSTSVFNKIFNILEQYDIKFIKNNYENCILNKIFANEKIKLIVNNIKLIKEKLERIQLENIKTINNDVKDAFIIYLERLGFKYYANMAVTIDDESKALQIQLNDQNIIDAFRTILSESEKTILSLSLFLSIAGNNNNSLILIDDPVDSHDEKTKWFIINQIIEFYQKEDVLLIIFTHDLSISKSFSNVTNESIKNYIITQGEIRLVEKPSLLFQNVNDFIYRVIEIVKTEDNNSKYIIPLAFLMRYLTKYQKKLYIDSACSASCTVLSRKKVKEIGFENLSNNFVHFNPSINSEDFLSDLEKFMIFRHNGLLNPSYFNNNISSAELIYGLICDINEKRQFDIELKTILYSLLIRNKLEEYFLQGKVRRSHCSLGLIAEDYRLNQGEDKIYLFYIRNKTLVDDFAHIESGSNVLLTYDLEIVKEKFAELDLLI